MSNEIILHQKKVSIMENDNIFAMGNAHVGDLYLHKGSVDFVAAGGILSYLNKKNNQFLSETAMQNHVCVPLEHIAGVECIVQKVPFRNMKIATIRLHLHDGEILYFNIGKIEDAAQWLDAIRLQCVNNNLKRPYLKVNGELVN